MSKVYLCANVGGRQVSASGKAVEDLSEGLSKLYFPRAVTPAGLQEVSDTFGSWTINVSVPGKTGRGHLSIAEYIEMLSREEITPGFKDVLASVSRSPKEAAHQEALRHFDISRFCEFRVALGALRIPQVERVGVVAPNSRFDRMKADVLVFESGEDTARPFQVKATEGHADRLSKTVPTVNGAWRVRFSELASRMRAAFGQQR